MKKILIYSSLLFLFFIFHIERSQAYTILAGELSYKHLQNQTYEINAVVYYECGKADVSLSFDQGYQVDIFSMNYSKVVGFEKGSYHENLYPKSKSLISACAGKKTTCEGGAVIGIYKIVYSGTTTFPATHDDWYLNVYLKWLSFDVSNIGTREGDTKTLTSMALQATLDNKNFFFNNSPKLTFDPLALFNIGNSQNFIQSNRDNDGDILQYSLIEPQSHGDFYPQVNKVVYNPPFTYTNPISSSTPFTLNATNGTITVSPTALQSTIFTVLIKEIRNGLVAGTVKRYFYMRSAPPGFYCAE